MISPLLSTSTVWLTISMHLTLLRVLAALFPTCFKASSKLLLLLPVSSTTFATLIFKTSFLLLFFTKQVSCYYIKIFELIKNAEGGSRTHKPRKGHDVLSVACLPIPPPRQKGLVGIEPTAYCLRGSCSAIELQTQKYTPGRTRTCSLQIRNLLLYPVELPGLNSRPNKLTDRQRIPSKGLNLSELFEHLSA